MLRVMARDIIRGQAMNTIQSVVFVMGAVKLKMCMKIFVRIAMENTSARQASRARSAGEQVKRNVRGAEERDTPIAKFVMVRGR